MCRHRSRTTKTVAPVYEELIRQAAQGELLHNDDTTMRILGLTGETEAEAYAYEESKRKGVFTSGIVSLAGGRRMALFFTGWRHAGENLAEVLRHRAADLAAPIQMCDALSRNEPKGFETILANCNAHGRRQFVEVAESFRVLPGGMRSRGFVGRVRRGTADSPVDWARDQQRSAVGGGRRRGGGIRCCPGGRSGGCGGGVEHLPVVPGHPACRIQG